jgi:hypothetical protein
LCLRIEFVIKPRNFYLEKISSFGFTNCRNFIA